MQRTTIFVQEPSKRSNTEKSKPPDHPYHSHLIRCRDPWGANHWNSFCESLISCDWIWVRGRFLLVPCHRWNGDRRPTQSLSHRVSTMPHQLVTEGSSARFIETAAVIGGNTLSNHAIFLWNIRVSDGLSVGVGERISLTESDCIRYFPIRKLPSTIVLSGRKFFFISRCTRWDSFNVDSFHKFEVHFEELPSLRQGFREKVKTVRKFLRNDLHSNCSVPGPRAISFDSWLPQESEISKWFKIWDLLAGRWLHQQGKRLPRQ